MDTEHREVKTVTVALEEIAYAITKANPEYEPFTPVEMALSEDKSRLTIEFERRREAKPIAL